MAEKPVIHGRGHSPGGDDPLKSWGADDGDVITADGAGGISWAPGGSGGIQFNTRPQDGGYLYIHTNSQDSDGRGFHFVDIQYGMKFDTGGPFEVVADGPTSIDSVGGFWNSTGDLGIQGNDRLTLTSTDGTYGATINLGASGSAGAGGDLLVITNNTSTGTMYFSSGAGFNVETYSGQINLKVGFSGGGGNQINFLHDSTVVLRVDCSTSPPTYHGVTGGIWVFDL